MDEENLNQEQGYRERYVPQRLLYSRAKRKTEEVFKETFGAEIDMNEVENEFENIDSLEEIASTQVNMPSFPWGTFIVALTVDICGLSDFTGVGWFVMVVVEIVFSIILFILMFRKLNSTFTVGSKVLFRGKKGLARKGLKRIAIRYLRKYMTRRIIAILIVKVIPFLGILASDAFFVVLAHNKHKKIAKKYIYLVEKVSSILKRHNRSRR